MHIVNGRNISDIVNRDDWQKLRRSLLGTWLKTPKENVIKLRNFLGDIENAEMDKLIIVYNYLTGSVFRTKLVEHPSIDKLKKEIKDELIRRKKLLS
jgi:hypothetical protein